MTLVGFKHKVILHWEEPGPTTFTSSVLLTSMGTLRFGSIHFHQVTSGNGKPKTFSHIGFELVKLTRPNQVEPCKYTKMSSFKNGRSRNSRAQLVHPAIGAL